MTAPTDFIEIPSGALCGEIIPLTCKGPDEERSYVIEYSQQLDPDDYISPTGITWYAGDTALSVTNVTSHGRRFRFTLNGGTLNQKSGITFIFPLVSGDVREITFAITVESQGVLQTGTVPVIMGAQGRRGTMIFLYGGEGDPTAGWEPDNGYALLTGDFVLNLRGDYMKQVTVNNDGSYTWGVEIPFGGSGGGGGANADTLINTETNSKTLGWILDNFVVSKATTDFFSVNSSGALILDTTKLQTTNPKVLGAAWNNGGFFAISNG